MTEKIFSTKSLIIRHLRAAMAKYGACITKIAFCAIPFLVVSCGDPADDTKEPDKPSNGQAINPGGNDPGGNNPGGNDPGGNDPGGNDPGGNDPGGNDPGGNNTDPVVIKDGTATVITNAQTSAANHIGAIAAALEKPEVQNAVIDMSAMTALELGGADWTATGKAIEDLITASKKNNKEIQVRVPQLRVSGQVTIPVEFYTATRGSTRVGMSLKSGTEDNALAEINVVGGGKMHIKGRVRSSEHVIVAASSMGEISADCILIVGSERECPADWRVFDNLLGDTIDISPQNMTGAGPIWGPADRIINDMVVKRREKPPIIFKNSDRIILEPIVGSQFRWVETPVYKNDRARIKFEKPIRSAWFEADTIRMGGEWGDNNKWTPDKDNWIPIIQESEKVQRGWGGGSYVYPVGWHDMTSAERNQQFRTVISTPAYTAGVNDDSFYFDANGKPFAWINLNELLVIVYYKSLMGTNNRYKFESDVAIRVTPELPWQWGLGPSVGNPNWQVFFYTTCLIDLTAGGAFTLLFDPTTPRPATRFASVDLQDKNPFVVPSLLAGSDAKAPLNKYAPDNLSLVGAKHAERTRNARMQAMMAHNNRQYNTRSRQYHRMRKV